MIYSNSNKFMFYHIPKTAGQSLHNVLRKYTVGDHVNEYYVTIDSSDEIFPIVAITAIEWFKIDFDACLKKQIIYALM